MSTVDILPQPRGLSLVGHEALVHCLLVADRLVALIRSRCQQGVTLDD
jgi:hypothetical protein